MVCCSAPNCANSSRKGFRLFRFPVDPVRREKWISNCRRDKWEPRSTSRLCEAHFEPSQWELKRKDGWIRLKPNSVPTLFNLQNSPPKVSPSSRKSKYKNTFNKKPRAPDIRGQIFPVDTVLNYVPDSPMEIIEFFNSENGVDSDNHVDSSEECVDTDNFLISLPPEDEIKYLKEHNKKLKFELDTVTSRLQDLQQRFQALNDKHEEEIRNIKTLMGHRISLLQSFLNDDKMKGLNVNKMSL